MIPGVIPLPQPKVYIKKSKSYGVPKGLCYNGARKGGFHMTTGDKLAKLRREHNYTQEQLAELLGVSRQAISKWESGVAYPETEKLIRLGRLYNCSMDYLLLDEVQEEQRTAEIKHFDLSGLYMERVSRKKIGNLPLWHVNIGYGRVAKGVFAVGLASKGIFSVGLFSLGLVSFGICSVGLIAVGSLAAGLIAIGAIAAGILSLGAVAVGTFSLGACAIGQFAVGAAAMGNYAALGDAATAAVAIGASEANGSLYSLAAYPISPQEKMEIAAILDQIVPWYFGIFKKLFLLFVP